MSERAPQVGDVPAFKLDWTVTEVLEGGSRVIVDRPGYAPVWLYTDSLTFSPPPYTDPDLRPGDIVRSVGEADEREWCYLPINDYDPYSFVELGGNASRLNRASLPDHIRVVSRREDRR